MTEEAITRIRESYGENRVITGEYEDNLSAKCSNGVFVGAKSGNVAAFRGIPFAKPPVGELRWKAPEPLPASEDVFEAEYFGASAIQVDHKGVILQLHRQSEDCLTLNIITGAERTETKSVRQDA